MQSTDKSSKRGKVGVKRFWTIMWSVVVLLGVMRVAPGFADETVQVSVSILPQKYFVERIGGERVSVSAMVEPGANPHLYDPRPQQMVALSQARIYFAAGVPFENVWLPKFAAANPRMIIVHTEAGIEKIPMASHGHSAGEEEKGRMEDVAHSQDHPEGVLDPHIWLSPPLVMIQARHILDGLLQVDPANKSFYQANYRNFILEIVDLDGELMSIFLDGRNAREFMVFHPAWGYFAEAYGLREVPIEVEGKQPKAADLKRLIEYAGKNGIKVVFVQPQFSATSAKVIADAIGGQVVTADPLAFDWTKNLREVGQKFKDALK